MRRKILFGLCSLLLAGLAGVVVLASPGNEGSVVRPAPPVAGPVAAAEDASATQPHSSTTNERLTMTIEASVSKSAVMPEAQLEYAELVIYGTVVGIAPGRWNSPDGKAWKPDSETDTPAIYSTFYVEPTKILKGEPRFGTPVAFMIPGGTEGVISCPVAVGDRVIVFGRYMQELYGNVYWDKTAYFPQSMDYSIYLENADGKLTNLGDPHLAALSSMTVEQMTAMATLGNGHE